MIAEIRTYVISISVVSLFTAAHLIAGATAPAPHGVTGGDPVPTPEKVVFSAYKAVSIGMKADDVRTKLGAPKDKSDAMDLYVFSDSESAQFYYDAAGSVTAIMITYSGDLKLAPTPKDIFGEDAPVKEDGGIFKMVRYPKAGFWISYNRSGGADGVVSVAMQKI